MCGRFTGLTYDQVAEVVAAVEAGGVGNAAPDWPAQRADIRPGSQAWIIVPGNLPGNRAEEGSLTSGLAMLAPFEAQWGFPVEWSNTLVFNTRIETATGANPGMWQQPIREGRCLVPALRFFEPHATETVASPASGRMVKRQYAFEPYEQGFLLMAAVVQGSRFSIVTTKPNACVAPVHDRMPLVVQPHEVPMWLGPCFVELADRASVELRVQPEPLPNSYRESTQLRLF